MMIAHEESIDPRVARRRAYQLLGGLLLEGAAKEGLDASRLAAVQGLPGLGEGLPATADLDALAADHYALFGHELFPFAGAFLGEDGLVGIGVAASVVRAAHAVVGVVCEDDPSPDHLGQGLRLMALLVEVELEARAHGDEQDAHTLVRWQRRVLDQAILPWMPPLYAALAGQPASLWTRAVELAVGVLARHRSELGGLRLAMDLPGDAAGSIDAVLDDPRAGLAAVAQALVTPVRSGVYLARRDLAALARRSDLPQGFGSRQDVLERLLRVAAEYRVLPRVLDELRRLLEARDDAYAGLAAEPGLAPHVPGWRWRLAGSVRLVERLHDAA
jgi:TorA maturation chaperone TorD